MSIIGFLHKNIIYDRRIRVLSGLIERAAEAGDNILDIGCGDGLIVTELFRRRTSFSSVLFKWCQTLRTATANDFEVWQ